MEGPHRQLGTWLTDRLRGHDADSLTDVDHQPLASERPQHMAQVPDADSQVRTLRTLTVVTPASTSLAMLMSEIDPGAEQHFPVRAEHVRGQRPRVDSRLDVLVEGQPTRFVAGDGLGQAALRAAVLLADDDVLGDVDEPTGQVTRVRGTQRRVRLTLAAAGVERSTPDAQASRKLDLIGRAMISPFGLTTRPRMAAIWRICTTPAPE